MNRILSTLLLLAVILAACAPRSASPSPAPVATTPPPSITPGAPTADPQNCGYQWAYQDLPELSSSFQESLRQLEPQAEGNAFAFGENCILSDGTIARFLPMETDFNAKLHVDDLANEAVLGRWIVNVMQIIEAIPAEQIMGPRPGRVSIVYQSSTAQSITNFYINQYQALPAGLNHTEIYEALQAAQ